jgi:CheY-like chemotaxis protein
VQGIERERGIIERQVTHVVALVDDLLDVSRITRGAIELTLERVNLADAVMKAVEQAAPLIESRRHHLIVDVADNLYVRGDSRRLSQIVANVLTNAAKYTDPCGKIEVRGVAGDGVAVLHVRDDGIGMTPEMIAHAFDAFTQGRQRSDRSHGGLGLGLAIVRSLVQAHGGSVSLHSDGDGCGTECVVTLPLAAATDAPAAASPTIDHRRAAGGCRVLIVDDNEDAAAMLAASLEAFGHQLEVARDAPSALAASSWFVPDVALLDLGLPVVDGYELASRLREQPGWHEVRFAALTGYGQRHDHQRTSAAGFAAHLVKPVDVALIDRTVRDLCARADLQPVGPGQRVRPERP